MSPANNPYGSFSRRVSPKQSRFLVLFLLSVILGLLLIVIVPFARTSLLRQFDEFGVTLPAFSLLVYRFYPELLAIPVWLATLVIEFVVPSAVFKNRWNTFALSVNLLLLFLIVVGFGVPALQIL